MTGPLPAGFNTGPLPAGFNYVDGILCAEGVALDRVADTVGTPFYCYAATAIAANYAAFEEAFAGRGVAICYAVKANSNLAVIRTLAELGAGADIVSEGELRRAIAAGVAPDRIVYSGVGKTDGEIDFALATGIHQFNVESEVELDRIAALARAAAVTAPVALRINPDIDAATHDKIATGRSADKFGIPIDRAADAYARASSLAGIAVTGLAIHIGSQLTDLAPFRAAFNRIADLVVELRAAGHTVDRLDLGGGLGIDYGAVAVPAIADYARLIEETVGRLGCALIVEPGRAIVGSAGVLVARVVEIKLGGGGRRIVVIDAAMNDLLRPALYDADHQIRPVRAPVPGSDDTREIVDVVGPICESGDRFAEAREMAPLAAGDLLAVCDAGAYGAVMASSYNSRRPVPETMVRGGDFAVIRPRPEYDSLMSQDRMPGWLDGSSSDLPAAKLRAGAPE